MLKNFTVLYVEDDKDAQEFMKLILQDSVKKFYQSFNGQEGLESYKKFKQDIVITDINMDILDGLSMSKEIKSIDRQQTIFVMSAFNDRNVLMDAINIGIDYFIPKPVDMPVFMERLNDVAQNLQNKIDANRLREQELNTLYHLAHYDSLTQVANRFLFSIRLNEAISKAKRNDDVFSLFFIDLDNFKNINDTYGHLCGDEVLKSICKNIKKVIRLEDTFARISGDEFAIIVEGIDDKESIDRFAKKILEASSKNIECKDNVISVTCSIGISRFPKDSDVKNDLLSLADGAMYSAKKSGKSNFSYVENFKEL